MRAVRVVEGQPDFVVEEVAAPQRRQDGIVVRMEAAMVASYMAALPSGAWMTPLRPFIPGQCAIGVIEEGNAQLSKGQRVYFDAYTGSRDPADPATNHGFLGCFAVGEAALPMMRAWSDGSFAELIHAPANCFTPLPQQLEVAPELLCRLGWLGTACHGLERGGFNAGMRIAINGATGIVGASAVVLALALGAAEILIFGRREDRLSELVALDPDRVRIGQVEDDLRYDLVLDCAAAPVRQGGFRRWSVRAHRARQRGVDAQQQYGGGILLVHPQQPAPAYPHGRNRAAGPWRFQDEELRDRRCPRRDPPCDISGRRAGTYRIGPLSGLFPLL